MRSNAMGSILAITMLILVACFLDPMPTVAQMTSTGIDCSQIGDLRLLQQENMRAGLALMECGVIPRPAGGGSGNAVEGDEPAPPNIMVSNRPCGSGSSCTKSESMVYHSAKAGDSTVVVNYNDSNGLGTDYSGTSYSTDGGATFTEIQPPPFGTGHGTNFGDPIVDYNLKLQKWFAGDLVSGCGGQGIGLWSSPDGIAWTAGACAHSGASDDRESMWVDNNPFSAVYGRMYISFNNFRMGGTIQVVSSDDGVNWTAGTSINSGTFIRDVQLTGMPPGPPPRSARFFSAVFVAGMNEEGGGLGTRQNVMYRSLDGGASWSTAVMGAPFNAVGDGICPDGVFSKVNPIWRHMGWGEPGVGPNGVVHYVYAGQGQASGDHGDIYYVRSTDNGATWSTPLKLNDDTGGQFKTQWMPSLSINYNPSGFQQPGKVTVSWHDRRQATSACDVDTDAGCSYYRYGVQSPDNGVTWGPNFQISDVLIPQPTQDDGFVNPCYAGDYDYSTAIGNTAYVTWTDGRVSVGGVQVQNVEFSRVPEQ